jgi:AFG3 family protein
MEENKNNIPNNNSPRFKSYWMYGLLGLFLFGLSFLNSTSSPTTGPIDRKFFEDMVNDGAIEHIDIVNSKIGEIYLKKDFLNQDKYKGANKKSFGSDLPHYVYDFGPVEIFAKYLDSYNEKQTDPAKRINFKYETHGEYLSLIMNWLLPLLLIIGVWLFIMRRMGGGAGPGAQIFNIGRSKATLFDGDKSSVTFKDVAGLDEAKDEVMEIVDFLKNPSKYTSLGGKIPKGVLLVGPPGTGKTLLAKAVAGEAAVPFFSLSGSDFVEMFVGVGASRVRDLFRQAREKAPCIIFIDEIDAIGRARGRGAFQGGNDERENTLNQLLVEMDGFSTDKGVILMAATNRSDVLDGALTRPGRFDREIGIGLPDLQGRKQIFEVHLRSIKQDVAVDAEALAEMTPGFAGADIANVCNEAALIAARRNKEAVDMDDFNYALDKAIGGLEKRNKIISPEEKRVIAYHEAGHAICGWYLAHASPLVKVTIVPRGIGTLGYAQYLPKDEYIVRTEQLLDRMCMTLGGRAAESVTFDKISTGAQNDLDRVTQMAYSMISMYGMNDKVGNVSFYGMSQEQQFNRPYSENTAMMIDGEVRNLIESQYTRAKQLLRDKKDQLEILAQTLLEKEVLLKSDLEKLIGLRPIDIENRAALAALSV